MRIRRRTLGHLHRRVGGFYDTRSEGRRILNRSDAAFGNLAFHYDFAAAVGGHDVGLFDLVRDEAHRAAQREALGGSAACLADLKRSIGAALREDRLDVLTNSLADFAAEEHLARSGLARFRIVHEQGDVTGLLRIVRDVRRPDLEAVLLGHAVADATLRGAQAAPDIESAFAALTLEGSEPWFEVARALRRRLEQDDLAEAATVSREQHLRPPEPVTFWPQTIAPLDRARCVNQLASALRSVEEDSQPEEIARAAGALQFACSEPLDDTERATLARALARRTRVALARYGWTIVEAAMALFEGVVSDYYGALGEVVRAVVELTEGTAVESSTRVRLVARLARHPEAHYRVGAAGAVIESLGRHITRGAPLQGALTEIRALLDLEAAAAAKPTSDFVRFGIGRRAWSLARYETVRTVFDRLENPWVKGQLIRQAPLEALRDHDISGWLPEITNPLARAFSLVRFIEARGEQLSETAEDNVLSACRFEYDELTVSALEALLRCWAKGSQRAERLRCFWKTFGEPIGSLTGTFACRVARALGDEPGAPDAFRAWANQVAPTPSSVEPHRRIPVDGAFALDGEFLAVRLRSLAFLHPDLLATMSHEEATRVCHHVGESEATVDSVAVLLRLARHAQPLDSWGHIHRLAVSVGCGDVAPDDVLTDADATDALVEALVEWLAPTESGDALIARAAKFPAVRRAIRAREVEYREFDLGRTTALVAMHGRRMLGVLLGIFFDASFAGPPAARKPTAQRICAEALARCATETEFDALVERWAPVSPEVSHAE